MKVIPRQEVRSKHAALKNGTIYSVTFIKKDGSIRVMNSIKGTRRGINGTGLRFDAEEKGLIPVYDLQIAKQNPNAPEKAWRMINVNTIQTICVNKETLTVV